MARNSLLLLGVLMATLLVVSSAASAATGKTEAAADVQGAAAVGDQYHPRKCCRWYYGRCQRWCYHPNEVPDGAVVAAAEDAVADQYGYRCRYGYCCGGWFHGRCRRCCPAASQSAEAKVQPETHN